MSDDLPDFQALVAAGDEEAVFVNKLMNDQDYMRPNGDIHTTDNRAYVDRYFKQLYGTGPAKGSRQKNTTSRGGLRG
ncbi:hypothetical protein [Ruegeria atlantica]|uniref:hypothetical protein n=1 Tax=Ruegeria atlantica TaxID=81569 RepID=UPI002495A707|nr:hypothetical protein [Ruegeria atlantica]